MAVIHRWSLSQVWLCINYLEYLISFDSLINLNIFEPYIIDLKIGLPQRSTTKLKNHSFLVDLIFLTFSVFQFFIKKGKWKRKKFITFLTTCSNHEIWLILSFEWLFLKLLLCFPFFLWSAFIVNFTDQLWKLNSFCLQSSNCFLPTQWF